MYLCLSNNRMFLLKSSLFSGTNKEKIIRGIVFLLGLSLIASVPYSAGLGYNWFININSDYRVSFFYILEIIVYSFGFLLYGFHLKSKREKFLFISLMAIILSRVISLLFADTMQLSQLISVFRYIETFFAVYIVMNLLTDKRNRMAFVLGAGLGAFLESIAGIIKYIISEGNLRGILIGISSYQIAIFLILAILIIYSGNKKHYLFLLIVVLVLGILSTQTRSGLLQFILGLMLLAVYAVKLNNIRLIVYSLLTVAITYTGTFFMQKFAESAKERLVIETMEGGGTIHYRLYLWDKALGAFVHNPITGIGSGGFGKQLGELPQIFDVKMEGEKKHTPISAHSTVFGIMAETGSLGLGAYILWAMALIRIVCEIVKKRITDPFVVSCAILISVFIFSDIWSINSFHPNTSFILAFILGYLREATIDGIPS